MIINMIIIGLTIFNTIISLIVVVKLWEEENEKDLEEKDEIDLY
jgi:hypothetical protein